RSGLGAVNKLKVERALDGTYSCFINGTQVAAGISPLENGTAGVRVFFSVGQEQQENLPDVPVRVSYRITESKAP
ncbi:MAG: hypothetical protein IJ191_08955, partial [Treponema sp.]|nr:hypothetical protein [Treponema sp.]